MVDYYYLKDKAGCSELNNRPYFLFWKGQITFFYPSCFSKCGRKQP